MKKRAPIVRLCEIFGCLYGGLCEKGYLRTYTFPYFLTFLLRRFVAERQAYFPACFTENERNKRPNACFIAIKDVFLFYEVTKRV